MIQTTDAVIQHGRESIKAGSKSLALASRLFPEDLRNDVAQLYAWCRYSDDVIDGQHLGYTAEQAEPAHHPLQRLQLLERRTAAALRGNPDDDPVFLGLARVTHKYDIAPQQPLELLRGLAMDVQRRRYQTLTDLMQYCYCVAGAVGVMMARVMGVKDEAILDRACDLGLAFQLTNIARDVMDDARIGRVYLPTDLLEDHGAPTEAHLLLEQDNWPQAYQATCELLDTADVYYRSAAVGLRALPFRCAWAVKAASNVYQAIGTELRRRGPRAWEERVSTSQWRKMWLGATALPIVPVRPAQRPVNLYRRPRPGEALTLNR
ncbi:phytoene/squalene synthase family protein [Gilvimarinus sp. F26214L]|uniref:phytoene/squalene synthase family protein n=1 Tax=Gilvimarinus sp. DZF01 TaxID=3461371 RepID=UPI004045B362